MFFPSPSASAHPKYRPDIDGLRAIAILSVLGYHFYPELIRGGFIGVDVFFVISGYLISSIIFAQLSLGSFSLKDFYVKRIKRIFPALLLVLLATLIIGWALLLPDEYREAGKHITAGSLFLSNVELIKGAGYFDTGIENKPLAHLWSLAVEEQFYVLWPLLLMFAWRRHWGFLSLTLVIAAASFGANLYYVHHNQVVGYLSPLTRFWELMIGGLLAYFALHRSQWLHALPGWAGSLGLAMILIGIALIDKQDAFPGYLALLPTFGAFLIIATGTRSWSNRYLLAHPIPVWIGLISFPLYLWHWLALFAFHNLSIDLGSAAFDFKLAILVMSFMLAGLTYWFVEKPVRTSSAKLMPLYLISMMVVVGLAGLAVYKANGFPWRYTGATEMLSVTAKDFRWKEYIRHGICNLNIHQARRAPECVERRRPMIMLWGDSHAASLYPGFRDEQKVHDIGITQLTQNACGPFFTLHGPLRRADCNEINEGVLETAHMIQPDIIVLHAAWEHHDYPLSRQEISDKLEETINKIHAATPTSKVIVLGPVPRWDPSLAKVVSNQILARGGPVPNYLPNSQAKQISSLDRQLQEKAVSLGVEYISLFELLCTQGGECLVRTGRHPTDFTAVDYGHLSRAGAEYVVEKALPQILNGKMDSFLK